MTDQDYTHLLLIADRSGSMHGIHTDMNGAILQLLADQAKEPGRMLVDICTFDNVVEFTTEDVDPMSVAYKVIQPRGSTALNDAIGVAVTRLGKKLALMPEDSRPGHVMVVVVTDGMENASQEWTKDGVKALVTEQTDKWGWQFIYLAANVDAFETGGGYGFAKGSTMNFAASSAGVANSYGSASRKMSETRSGLSSTVTFDDEDREEAMEK